MLLINVPYSEKDEAKALGAKWNPDEKSWMAPGNTYVDYKVTIQSPTQTAQEKEKTKHQKR